MMGLTPSKMLCSAARVAPVGAAEAEAATVPVTTEATEAITDEAAIAARRWWSIDSQMKGGEIRKARARDVRERQRGKDRMKLSQCIYHSI